MAIAGNYEIEIETPMGSLTAKIALLVDRDQLGGICSTRWGDQPITGTVVSDQEITFSTRLNTPMGQIKVNGSGTIVGDEISGQVAAGSFGSFPFKGKKK